MRVLVLYNASQTFTETVFEHLDAFREYSCHEFYYSHHDLRTQLVLPPGFFDAVVVHYSIRLPFDQLGEVATQSLAEFPGRKILFIQDEYDHTNRTKYWLTRIGFDLVFTVVPPESIERIYPQADFPRTRFVSNLTGYVPRDLGSHFDSVAPPSSRSLIVGYRARPLPIRYGALGVEKVEIGRVVKAHCRSRGIRCDIAWTEESRIYGPRWYQFVASCRGMLGSESGSNVFDWDGTLAHRIRVFRAANGRACDSTIYRSLVEPLEQPGLMNQVSPRIFEMISARTAMVLIEGNYSGVVVPNEHYIPIKKDFSNLDEVFERLADGAYVDALTERAYHHVVKSGRYSYRSFVGMVDAELDVLESRLPGANDAGAIGAETSGYTQAPAKAEPPSMTRVPIKSKPPPLFGASSALVRLSAKGLRAVWSKVPLSLRPHVKKLLGRV
jgi:hypothetical protein